MYGQYCTCGCVRGFDHLCGQNGRLAHFEQVDSGGGGARFDRRFDHRFDRYFDHFFDRLAHTAGRFILERGLLDLKKQQKKRTGPVKGDLKYSNLYTIISYPNKCIYLNTYTIILYLLGLKKQQKKRTGPVIMKGDSRIFKYMYCYIILIYICICIIPFYVLGLKKQQKGRTGPVSGRGAYGLSSTLRPPLLLLPCFPSVALLVSSPALPFPTFPPGKTHRRSG